MVECVQDSEFVRGQGQSTGGHVLGEMVEAAGTGDDQDVGPLVQGPRQPYLGRADSVGAGDGAHLPAVVGGRAPSRPGPAIEQNGTNAMRCSPQLRRNFFCSGDAPIPYMFCTQTTGAMVRASARWWGRTLDRPRWRMRPAARSSASAPKRSAMESMPTMRRFTTSRWSRPSWRGFSSGCE